jgi:ATP-binding cassette subfamily F protein 3
MMFEGDDALKKISVLSGGERSRVLLGKILVSPANLLFLDEPTNHLDMESIDSLVEAIEAFDGAVVIVTHSEMILHAVAERLVIFDDNKVNVFEGTYQDFLDRVGWKDETSVAGASEMKPKTEKGMNRKDLRKMRAEIITNKSKALNPIQKRMTETEHKIEKLEKRVENNTAALHDATQKGLGVDIQTLSKDIYDSQQKIEALFDELAKLTEEFEKKSREFGEKLSAFV